MSTSEGVPWIPERLDDYLDEPFQEIESRRNEDALRRLERMEQQLDLMAAELDRLLEQRELTVR